MKNSMQEEELIEGREVNGLVANVEIFMEPLRNIDLLADKRSHERLFLARR
jgi:hypothetical protein